jgi:hypothetical protein
MEPWVSGGSFGRFGHVSDGRHPDQSGWAGSHVLNLLGKQTRT